MEERRPTKTVPASARSRRSGWFWRPSWLAWLLAFLITRFGIPATPVAGAAPWRFPTDLSVRTWNVQDGLPLTTVEAVLQTRDGYLWFGMNDGLCRFDGTSFQVFDPRNTPALPVSYITALAEDRDGSLWVGSAGGGLARLQEGVFERFAHAQGLTNEQVKALHLAADGRLWIGTDGGGIFVRHPSGQFQAYGERDGLPSPFVDGLTDDAQGTLYAALREEGPFRLEGNRFVAVPLVPPVASGSGFALTRSPAGQVWLGTQRGVYQLTNDHFRRWEEPASLVGHDPLVAWPVNEREVWVGTAQGLVRWMDGSWTPYPIGGGSSGRFARAFTIDQEGNLWKSTEGGGLIQLRRTKVVTLGTRDGLPGDEVTSVLEARDGSLWVGTSRGLSHFVDGQIKRFTKSDGLPDDFIFSLLEDRDGTVWISTRLGGLARYRDGRFEPLPADDLEPARKTWCLYGAQDGSVWAGSSAGAFQYRDGRRVQHLRGPGALSNDDVRAILEDRQGQLWIGTSYGLNRIANGKSESFTVLPGTEAIEVVVALYLDSQGDLWIGTATRGLFRYRDGHFVQFSTRNGLVSNSVLSILEDVSGHLWIGTSRGILRISKDSLESVAQDPTRVADVQVLGRADGLRTDECTGTIQPVSLRDRQGRLWFATAAGLATVDPGSLVANPRPPVVHIEYLALESPDSAPRIQARVRSGGYRDVEAGYGRADAPVSSTHRPTVFTATGVETFWVPPNQPHIEFQYVGLSFVSPASVSYRFKLENYDTSWVDAGHRRAAYYTRVPPGHYTFRVQATSRDGATSEPGAVLNIVVLPAWWQTAWVRIIALVAILGSVMGIYTRHVRRLERERTSAAEFSRRLLQSQEEERARVAGELHDGLGPELQLIRNRSDLALQRHDPNATLARELIAISATAGRAIEGVRTLARALRPPELDQLGLTQALRWLGKSTAEGIHGRLESRIDEIDGLLTRDRELHFYRIAQEALSNAIKHSAAGEISLEAERRNDGIHLSVFDNGEGFGPVADDARAPGSGLKTMHERAAILGGTLEIRTESGVGTRLTLFVPAVAQPTPAMDTGRS